MEGGDQPYENRDSGEKQSDELSREYVPDQSSQYSQGKKYMGYLEELKQ